MLRLTVLQTAYCYVKKSLTIFGFSPAGDAGGALGAALSTSYLHYNTKRFVSKERDAMKGAYLGPEFTDAEIEAELMDCGAPHKAK